MGGRRAAHGGDGAHARAHRRVRLEPHRTRAGPLRVGLARPRHRNAPPPRPRRDPRHADRDATQMAGGCDAGHGRRRRPRPATPFRFASALLLLARRLSRGVEAHHRSSGCALRPEPCGRRLADRQRIRLPRHGGQPLRRGGAGVPRLARGALRRHRRAQRRMGHGVLERRVPFVRRDRPALAHRHGAEPRTLARLPALLLRSGAVLQPRAGRHPARALSRPRHHAQRDGLRHLLRPPRLGA